MPKDTLTFELGGPINIGKLEKSIHNFHRLVKALTPRNSGVSWIVEELGTGSAVATLRGEADDVSVVEKIVQDYETIGATLQGGESPTGFGKSVLNAAEALRAMADTAPYVRLATPADDFIVTSHQHQSEPSGTLVSIGAVSGRIETLSSRGALRFNLYDSVFDKAVACYLAEGQEDLMRKAWGRRARVSGRVYREPKGGRAVSIRRITNVEILPEIESGAFRQAKGAVAWQPDYERGEVIIRRLRDA